MNTPYHKQTVTEPAFPERIWSQPEQAARRGKLVIIGGNANGVSSIMNAYGASQQAGIGDMRVVLPDSLKSVTGKILEHGTYAPRNPSGGFSKEALAVMIDTAQWADGALFAGDLAKNSETMIVMERFVEEYPSWILYCNDAVDAIIRHHEALKKQSRAVLVISIAQLQALIKELKLPRPVAHDMGLSQLVPLMTELSQTLGMILILQYNDGILAACEGTVSFTEIEADKQPATTVLASYAAVWLIQQPEVSFEAITSAVWLSSQTVQAA